MSIWMATAIILASAAMLVFAMVILKIVFDGMDDFKQDMRELKTQAYNNQHMMDKINKDFRVESLEVGNYIRKQSTQIQALDTKYRDLEYHVLKPQAINLFTKEPLLVKTVDSKKVILTKENFQDVVAKKYKHVFGHEPKPHQFLPATSPLPMPKTPAVVSQAYQDELNLLRSQAASNTLKKMQQQIRELGV